MRNKKEKGSGGFSRHQDPTFINAFGDKITAIAEKAEKRVRTGMGLREQEQVLHVLCARLKHRCWWLLLMAPGHLAYGQAWP